jgi:hypothetical protein
VRVMPEPLADGNAIICAQFSTKLFLAMKGAWFYAFDTSVDARCTHSNYHSDRAVQPLRSFTLKALLCLGGQV